MTVAARSFDKTIIETKPGVDKKHYLEQFTALAFTTGPNGSYGTDIALDEKSFQPTFNFLDWLSANGELASEMPLAPVAKNPEVKFGDLSPELKRLFEGYPLVDGEKISSIKMLCLEKAWEGLPNRTVFVERETNLSRAYFAVPSLRADPQSLDATPALLLRLQRAPVAKATLANTALSGQLTSSTALTAPSTGDMISVSLDIVSTLSWAIPEAGPFVSAGVTFVKFLFGFLFPPEQSSLLTDIKSICDGVVTRLEAFMEVAQLKEGLKGLEAFSDWIKTVETRLDTTNPVTIANEAAQLLATLEHQFDPAFGRAILSLKSGLYHDADLASGGGYDSASRWSIASAKLNLLFFTEAQYLLALKLKMLLIANLYELGYDYQGKPIDPAIPNPDNTFSSLVKEVRDIKTELPGFIANVRPRRAGMVGLVENVGCTVAYSQEQKPVGNRADWKLTRHDALYTGPYHDQMVRSIEDNPSVDVFERSEQVICAGIGVSRTCMGTGHYSIVPYSWQRTEVRDPVVYDGKNPQDWVLCDYGATGWYSNLPRAQGLKAEYVAGVLREFDKLTKIPDALNPDTLQASLAKLSDKWTPQIPKDLPNNVGLNVKSWTGTAGKDDLWSDPKVTVMYRFTLRSAGGTESAKPDKPDLPDKTTTLWLEPKGHNNPEIVGLPTEGKYLDYVRFVCVYRQFRKELAGGGYKYGKERKIKMIGRDAKKVFAIGFVDDASTDFDKTELLKA